MPSLILSYLADALAHEPDGPEYALPADEIYTLLRLCLLRRDGRLLSAHRDAARHLHGFVMARYRDAGAYIGTSEGTRYVDGVALRSIVWRLCEDNSVTISRDSHQLAMVTGPGWPGAATGRQRQ
jgi:hypothetical protein